MIDSSTGNIIFNDGASVGPLTTRTGFLRSSLFANSESSSTPGSSPWSRLTLAPRAMDGLAFLFGAKLYFNGEKLAWVDLWQIDPSASTDWNDWSMDGEIARQARNEAWLASFLGPPHECYALSDLEPDRYPKGNLYRFPWGTIVSSFSPQTGGAGLAVTYDRSETKAATPST